jgi:hypothetical protein
MHRYVFALAAALAACSAGAAAEDSAGCRPAYVVPYSEQCDFGHASIKKDGSPRNVAAAYEACDRAQTEAGNCLSSKVRQLHVVALSALYRAVSEQADIAMFAGQYKTAEALLGEKTSILDIAAREAKPGDGTIAAERQQTKTDLATSQAGECLERAYLAGSPARAFAHDHRYKDLEKTLAAQYAQYSGCANMEVSQPKKAYVQYVALVALEESGRAAQAAGDGRNANKLFAACLTGTARVQNGSADTERYLSVLTQLCKGRMNGTYRVDQPRPLDREGEGFKPLALPAS